LFQNSQFFNTEIPECNEENGMDVNQFKHRISKYLYPSSLTKGYDPEHIPEEKDCNLWFAKMTFIVTTL